MINSRKSTGRQRAFVRTAFVYRPLCWARCILIFAKLCLSRRKRVKSNYLLSNKGEKKIWTVCPNTTCCRHNKPRSIKHMTRVGEQSASWRQVWMLGNFRLFTKIFDKRERGITIQLSFHMNPAGIKMRKFTMTTVSPGRNILAFSISSCY